MRLPVKRLRVYPNPWGAKPWGLDKVDPSALTIDSEGRPCGVVPVDKYEGGGAGYVGAEIDEGKSFIKTTAIKLKAKRKVGVALDEEYPRQRTVWAFLGVSAEDPDLAKKLAACEPEEIPASPYYREQLQDGSLIAADEATAKVTGHPFVDPKKLLPDIEAAAIKAFDSSYEDPDAFKYFQSERAARVAKPAEPAADPAPSGDGAQSDGKANKDKKGTK